MDLKEPVGVVAYHAVFAVIGLAEWRCLHGGITSFDMACAIPEVSAGERPGAARLIQLRRYGSVTRLFRPALKAANAGSDILRSTESTALSIPLSRARASSSFLRACSCLRIGRNSEPKPLIAELCPLQISVAPEVNLIFVHINSFSDSSLVH